MRLEFAPRIFSAAIRSISSRCSDCGSRSAGSTSRTAVVRLSHELAMPTEHSVRRGDAVEFAKCSPTEGVSGHGKAPAFRIRVEFAVCRASNVVPDSRPAGTRPSSVVRGSATPRKANKKEPHRPVPLSDPPANVAAMLQAVGRLRSLPERMDRTLEVYAVVEELNANTVGGFGYLKSVRHFLLFFYAKHQREFGKHESVVPARAPSRPARHAACATPHLNACDV